ncbi:hypothetical protein ABPG73_020951 [Tetrahymena malaccensis]
MGNINGCCEGYEQVKNEIKNIVQNMNEIEYKINKANKKLLVNLKRLLNPNCYQIEDKTIIVFHTESTSSFFDKDELEYCQRQMLKEYRYQIQKYLDELRCHVLKGLFYTENCSAYQNNIDFLILKQYIKSFYQNEFQYEIIDISQQDYYKQQNLNTLQSFGDLRESIIIN